MQVSLLTCLFLKIVATCLPTDSCLLNRHGNVTEMSRKSYGKVTERSRKASVGRQGDSIIQQATHHHHPPKTFLTLPEVLTPSVIPFWKPLMTPNLNPNSDAKILQIFLQPIFANQNMKMSSCPTPKCYTFLETSHDPQVESQPRCQNLEIFLQPIFAN